jgi:cytolysin-activating lysine-acyltransferase
LSEDTAGATAPTVSHFLGEITWLLTQSPLHRTLTIGDLEWLAMPALVTEQFYVFRDNDRPIGLALWAKTDSVGEAKINKGIGEPENRLTLEEWRKGDRVWLVDLIAPFATNENRHRELMMADLVSGPLKGQGFSFHRTDAQGVRTVGRIEADVGRRLEEAVRQAAMAAGVPGGN